VERVGLGQANARYFLFHAGIGFDAAVVARVEKLAPLKRYTGPALFVMATLLTWAHGYDRKSPLFSVNGDGFSMAPSSFGICLNTDPYTFFGNRPMHVAPGTSLATPLSLVTIDRLRLVALVPVLVAAFRGGPSRDRGRHVTIARGVRTATITGLRPLPYQLDGDYMGEAGQIELRWSPDALALVKPLEKP